MQLSSKPVMFLPFPSLLSCLFFGYSIVNAIMLTAAGDAFLFASHSFMVIQETLPMWGVVFLDVEDFIRASELPREACPLI